TGMAQTEAAALMPAATQRAASSPSGKALAAEYDPYLEKIAVSPATPKAPPRAATALFVTDAWVASCGRTERATARATGTTSSPTPAPSSVKPGMSRAYDTSAVAACANHPSAQACRSNPSG